MTQLRRKMIFGFFAALPVVPVVVFLLLVSVSAAVPSGVANACLPCDCEENTALNCYGGFHLNTIVNSRGQCAIEVLGFNGDGGYLAIYASSRELARVPELPEENTLIEQYYEFSLYRLTTGEYQLNVGPDAEGKVYVVNWYGCPADNVRESTFTVELPPAGGE